MRRGIESLANVVYAPSAGSSTGASVFKDGASLASLDHQPHFPAIAASSPGTFIS